MRQPGRMLISLVLSVPLWLAIAAGIWLTSQAFHITFPFQASFLVITFLAVGVAVPTPGAVGGFHLAYQSAAAVFFGAPADRAVGAAIVLHAISFVPVTLLGIYFMAREGLTLAGARRMAEERSKRDEPRGADDREARDRTRGRRPRAMKCPYCGHMGDKVVDSRESREGDVIRRRRQCLVCAKRFTSRERIEEIEYRVVKKDGNREPFQRQKLIAGLLRACEKRPVSVQELEAIADRIETDLAGPAGSRADDRRNWRASDAGAQAARPGGVRAVRVGLPPVPRRRPVQARSRRAAEDRPEGQAERQVK